MTNMVKDRVSRTALDKTVFIRSDARAKYGDVVSWWTKFEPPAWTTSACSLRKFRDASYGASSGRWPRDAPTDRGQALVGVRLSPQ